MKLLLKIFLVYAFIISGVSVLPSISLAQEGEAEQAEPSSESEAAEESKEDKKKKKKKKKKKEKRKCVPSGSRLNRC